MSDTGLLFTHAFSENEETQKKAYRDVLFGWLQVNEGMLVKNAVARQHAASGHRLFFSRYDKNDSEATMEIEYLVSTPHYNAGLKQRECPIGAKGERTYLPLYMAHLV